MISAVRSKRIPACSSSGPLVHAYRWDSNNDSHITLHRDNSKIRCIRDFWILKSGKLGHAISSSLGQHLKTFDSFPRLVYFKFELSLTSHNNVNLFSQISCNRIIWNRCKFLSLSITKLTYRKRNCQCTNIIRKSIEDQHLNQRLKFVLFSETFKHWKQCACCVCSYHKNPHPRQSQFSFV